MNKKNEFQTAEEETELWKQCCESIITRSGSGYGSLHQAKIARKILIPTAL
jgi:hypothetical protein